MNRKLLFEKIDNHVKNHPEKTAVIYDKLHITYEQFNDKVNTAAQHILQLTKGENCIVPIRLKDNLHALITIFAILKAGAAYLPLPKEITTNKCKEILEDIETNFYITDFETTDFNKIMVPFNQLRKPLYEKKWQESVEYSDEFVSYIIYTSGTTGKPKGCVIEDKSLMQRITTLDTLFPFTKDDNYLFSTNYSFDVSVTEIFGWVLKGGTVTLFHSALEIKDLPSFIYNNNVTHLAFSPSYFRVLFKNQENYFSKVKYLLLAGEKFPYDLAKMMNQMDLNMNVINAYGPTEATIYSTYFEIKELPVEEISVPIGKPLTDVEILIWNKNQSIAKENEIGEILIGGPGLAREYYKREELTQKSFVMVGNKRFYRSGDLGKSKDGFIYCLGRKDNQIKINGIRVESEEIENKLKELMPIEDAVVRLEEFETKSFLVAYLQTATGLDTTPYIEELRGHLESYFIPKYFIAVREFPLNKNNKIDFPLLRKEFLNKMKKPNTVEVDNLVNSDVNSKLKQIWSDLLKSEINDTDHFYQIGGDSLDTIALLLEIEKVFGTILKYEDIISNPYFTAMEKLILEKILDIDVKSFKEYWLSNFNHELSFENNEKVIYVSTLKEKNFVDSFIQSLENEQLIPDRVLVNNQSNLIEIKYNVEPMIPVSAKKYEVVTKFPLFSRQEFYLRRGYNSYLIRDISITNKSNNDILMAINKLIETQLMLRVTISENQYFEVRNIEKLSFKKFDYYDLSQLAFNSFKQKVEKITNSKYERLNSLDVYDKFLYDIVLIKENNNRHRVIFFLNHHIADAFSLNVLENQFIQICNKTLEEKGNTNYKTFVEEVINLCNDDTIEVIKESDYYQELKHNFDKLNLNLLTNPNAPLYEIILENNLKDKEARANLVFDNISKIIEESYQAQHQCYQILKNLNLYNGKDYSTEVGDYHVSIFVPFHSGKEQNLFSKSEELLKDIYIEKNWHLDYLCSSERYKENEDMKLFPNIKLSINYLGEFTSEDLENWRDSLEVIRETTSKLNSKVRITCFNFKNKSYIYFLNNAQLSKKFDSFILDSLVES
ncbi:amino acid adenylation domain-containing protein [Bacillus mesophilus]|uniref:AMP-binding protein n=1 Tax=Bacillus mesophilus TaxID=1808955 RepID=A0A6M0QC32_9BACI|nr:non-ribosomal peptide synthetase [Bacillus mesophilus]MBM7662287.1 amino acid adenylation domain-containing protein [Bacillus mesophilus]NEY73080.1 AMP-binding protein [Bacillus mesophilus]